MRVRPRAVALLGLTLMAAAAAVARADALLPPWVEPGELPPPSWARSVVAKAGERERPSALTLFSGPSRGSGERGVTVAGTSLPFFGEKRGSGCSGRWWLVGPLAWVCSDDAELSRAEPQASASFAQPYPPASPSPAPAAPPPSSDDGLSIRYFFVSRDGGTSAYASLDSAVDGVSDHELEAGWAVGIVEQRFADARRWGRTSKGFWMAMSDLAPARPSAFHGEVIRDGRFDFAWVLPDESNVWSDPSRRARPVGTHARFERVWLEPIGPADAVGIRAPDADRMVRVGDARWMQARDLARPSLSAPPPEVAGAAERWIDVDLAAQILVAYEGTRPVYATLVSTGRGPAGTEGATPTGVHRIWVKLAVSDMNNVDREDADAQYSMEDVPYVQYFDGAVALHGTYWHDDFGRVKSHGCVNLAPIDARWLFAFTEPRLPPGWEAVLPTPLDPATVVRVR